MQAAAITKTDNKPHSHRHMDKGDTKGIVGLGVGAGATALIMGMGYKKNLGKLGQELLDVTNLATQKISKLEDDVIQLSTELAEKAAKEQKTLKFKLTAAKEAAGAKISSWAEGVKGFFHKKAD